jgi:Bacterial regulatory protein, Fis family
MGIVGWSSAMGRMFPHAPISSASRRRLARWLVGLPIRDVERDLVLETLANTHGNRTVSARLLGVSVRTLRNKISEYSAEGIDVPRHESGGLAKTPRGGAGPIQSPSGRRIGPHSRRAAAGQA